MALGWGMLGLWGSGRCLGVATKPFSNGCPMFMNQLPASKKNGKNLASQTDFQKFFQVQLSGQLEEREMARAMASYVFPMFRAGVGEETPAEIGILRMIWILSMKLGPDNMMKITMWVFPKIMVPPNHQF